MEHAQDANARFRLMRRWGRYFETSLECDAPDLDEAVENFSGQLAADSRPVRRGEMLLVLYGTDQRPLVQPFFAQPQPVHMRRAFANEIPPDKGDAQNDTIQ